MFTLIVLAQVADDGGCRGTLVSIVGMRVGRSSL